ncbi:MAG: exodeoxyribonuclease VII large subunit [Chitinivorax sp.]
MVADRVLSVSELNRSVRLLLEQSLPLAWISGEISNLTIAASGHWYFSLKDKTAQVRCVMFRGRTVALDFRPSEGLQVEIRATPGLYEPRGEFQLNVDFMRKAGLGALFEQFERLKAKLAAEGLFDATRKRPLPQHVTRIGIVTSPAAAALRDVLTTLRRRMPSIQVVLYPTLVQGEGAAAQITRAIEIANRRAEVELLIVCRGGGSIEDLWAFNEEPVARAIAASQLPVVSGVGHETDVTIADFVADRRAATPTAAAELVSPNRAEMSLRLQQLARRLQRDIWRRLQSDEQRLDYLARRLQHPGQKLQQQQQRLQQLQARLQQALARRLEQARWRLDLAGQRVPALRPDIPQLMRQQAQLQQRMAAAANRQLQLLELRLRHAAVQLQQLNPAAVLERGYSIVETSKGRVLTDASQAQLNQTLKIRLARGRVFAGVSAIEPADLLQEPRNAE